MGRETGIKVSGSELILHPGVFSTPNSELLTPNFFGD